MAVTFVPKFKETIVFTPHFGGDPSAIRRHQELFQQLGYATEFVPYSGLRHLWIDQLTDVLDRTAGPKIIFSFSFPSCIVFQLMAERPRSDVKGWITDGGPFLWPWTGIRNFFKFTRPELSPARLFVTCVAGFLVLGGPMYMRQIQKWIKKMPSDFPILSIRAGRDELVPEASIDALFSLRQDLKLKILRLPEAEHMLGLKAFPDKYRASVVQFLTPLTSG